MLEKKRIAGLGAEADEHDQMHAAGVPGHIMLQFRKTEAAFESEKRLFQEKLKKLRALGLSEEDVVWMWLTKTDKDGQKEGYVQEVEEGEEFWDVME